MPLLPASDERAWIIGGVYEGLCLAIAVQLARRGHPVVLLHRAATSRPQDEVATLQARIEAAFQACGWPLSVVRIGGGDDDAGPAGLAALAASAPPAIVVSGEGTNAYPPRDLLAFGDDDWQRAIDREIAFDIGLLRVLLPGMRERGRGRIINLGYAPSYWDNHLPFRDGHPLFVNNWPFVLGKDFRKDLFRKLAVSEYRYGITMNTISPGRVRNLPLAQLLDGSHPQCEVTSLDVAGLAAFLVSEGGRAVTGADIPVLNVPVEYGFASRTSA